MSIVVFRAQNKSSSGIQVQRNIYVKVEITNNTSGTIQLYHNPLVGFRFSGGDDYFYQLPVEADGGNITINAGDTFTFGPINSYSVYGDPSIVYDTTGWMAEMSQFTALSPSGRCSGTHDYFLYWNQTNTTVYSGTLTASITGRSFNTSSFVPSSDMTFNNPIGSNWGVATPLGMIWRVNINSIGS